MSLDGARPCLANSSRHSGSLSAVMHITVNPPDVRVLFEAVDMNASRDPSPPNLDIRVSVEFFSVSVAGPLLSLKNGGFMKTTS